MRHSVIILGALLFFAIYTQAQGTSSASAALPDVTMATAPPVMFAVNSYPDLAALPAKPEPSPSPDPAAMPQEVQGVYGESSTQVFIGYTYFRFFELPSTEQNLNGVDVSMAYYLKPWAAADLEVFDAAGSDGGKTANFVFFGAGPRVRWQTTKGIEFWIHGLGGVAHYSPTTIYGFPTGGAYEAGGGVDFGKPHSRWTYRLQGDLVGTFLFGVHQESARVAAGIVLKF
ncbi:MAG TPA: hypothetical protein VMU43_00370 [Candidatus Acidoferrum sp.]|nr:hypothetical protein [Candidatus Acidoferrum sp.]